MNETEGSIVHVSWQDVESYSRTLAEKIKDSGFVPDMLIGIAVGGLVPLTLLVRDLGIRNVTTITARSYAGKEQRELMVSHIPHEGLSGKKILLVDEIVDSGKTFRLLADMLVKEHGVTQVKTAAFFINTKHCTTPPDYVAVETDQWIQFPWEEPIGE